MMTQFDNLPTIDHVGFLEDLQETPSYLLDSLSDEYTDFSRQSCTFCGIGDSGIVEQKQLLIDDSSYEISEGKGTLRAGNRFLGADAGPTLLLVSPHLPDPYALPTGATVR